MIEIRKKLSFGKERGEREISLLSIEKVVRNVQTQAEQGRNNAFSLLRIKGWTDQRTNKASYN